MRLKSIETTPNPNSMKLNLDEQLGKTATYTKNETSERPQFVVDLLEIPGVQSVFVCSDFVTINRDPRIDWKAILDQSSQLMNGAPDNESANQIEEKRALGATLGQVSVLVQTFRGIPIQVKVVDADGEKRIALEQRFANAAQLVQEKCGADYLTERYWADYGARYGPRDEVAAEVVDEINGTIDERSLTTLMATALSETKESVGSKTLDAIKLDLHSDDWHMRLVAVQELGQLDDAVDELVTALKDPRLSAAALGASGSSNAIEPLATALVQDETVAVRRTAGDALSDLSDVSAQPAMCKALSDPNKLVRWRAARFLADIGTKEALPYLDKAVDDPEFEVRLEVQAAIERISGGKQTSEPVWKKILKL